MGGCSYILLKFQKLDFPNQVIYLLSKSYDSISNMIFLIEPAALLLGRLIKCCNLQMQHFITSW